VSTSNVGGWIHRVSQPRIHPLPGTCVQSSPSSLGSQGTCALALRCAGIALRSLAICPTDQWLVSLISWRSTRTAPSAVARLRLGCRRPDALQSSFSDDPPSISAIVVLLSAASVAAAAPTAPAVPSHKEVGIPGSSCSGLVSSLEQAVPPADDSCPVPQEAIRNQFTACENLTHSPS
jgi:hypothetical protein